MIQLQHLCVCLGILAGSVVIPSCSLDAGEEGKPLTPLTLHLSQELSLTNLSWNPVKVTGFSEYILLQSSEEIPDDPTPVANATTTIIKRIDDADITSHASTNILFSPRTCYKLYVAIGERFLYSPTVCVDEGITLIPGFYDRVDHEPGEQEVVMYDRNENMLSTYTLGGSFINKSISESFFSNPSINVSTYNDARQVFISDQSQLTIKRYNVPNLNSGFSKGFNTGIDALTSYGPFVLVAFNSSFSSFQVLNRNTLSAFDTRDGNTLEFGRTIAVFPGTPIVALEVGISNTNRYEINDLGKITRADQFPLAVGQSNLQGSTAQGEHIFITGFRGAIMNKEAQILGQLNPGFTENIFNVKLSVDEKTAIGLTSDNVSFSLQYYDVTDPAHIQVRKKLELPQGSFSDIIIENNTVYLFGVTFASGQSQTFILQFPMY